MTVRTRGSILTPSIRERALQRNPALEEPVTQRLAGFRGSNLVGVRAHNERLLLTLVRQLGPQPKAQIARMTGLSAQTVSVIVRALEADGLLARGKPVRGKVGQPSVPIGLAANGAFFFGLKIGRRSAELVLTNFLGQPVARTRMTYRYPTPAEVLRFTEDGIGRLARRLGPEDIRRIAGLGIAMPFEIWGWARTIGLSEDMMESWRRTDIRAEIEAICDYPVYLRNDGSAACGAELVFGRGPRPNDFLYFYIGYFIGGGVVLNGALFTGPTGNAGAIGPLPVLGPDGRLIQLLDAASLYLLERDLHAAGIDTDPLWHSAESWDIPPKLLDGWIQSTARALAQAIPPALSVIDFEAILIDGWMPRSVARALVEATRQRLAESNMTGLNRPEIREGSVGWDARALGAASLPLSERFLVHGAGAALGD